MTDPGDTPSSPAATTFVDQGFSYGTMGRDGVLYTATSGPGRPEEYKADGMPITAGEFMLRSVGEPVDYATLLEADLRAAHPGYDVRRHVLTWHRPWRRLWRRTPRWEARP